MSFRDIVGANTRRLRLQRGWTQQQLADLLGRHKQTVWAIEKGRHAITDRLIDELANVFQVGVEELVRSPGGADGTPHRGGAGAVSEGRISSGVATQAPERAGVAEQSLVALSREELEELVQRAAREAVRESLRVYRFEKDFSRSARGRRQS